jgi:anti-sigma factor RsiW
MASRRHPTDWERQREQLSAYIDGELSAAERAELERHIPGCPECQTALGELRQVHDLLAALPMPKAPRSFALHLDTRQDARPAVSSLASARPPRRPAARRGGAGLIQWAGGLAATIGLFLLLGGVVAGLFGSNARVSEASRPAGGSSVTSAQAPSATAPNLRTPDQAGTKGATGDQGQPAQATASTVTTATPTTAATYASPHITSAEPAFPILPVTGAGLLALGAGLYVVGRSRRRREPGQQPAG